MKRIICIDPGHGGADPGALLGSRHEADDNLRLARAVKELLLWQGHTAVLTHNGDIPLSKKLALEARSKIARDCKADLFISLHRNAHTDATARGVEIYIRNGKFTSAASAVYDAVSASGGFRSRGLKTDVYKVLYGLTMPSMLLELGFISNVADNALYDRLFNQNAGAVAKGILDALNEPWNNTPATPIWRVQVGAFRVESLAEAYVDKVTADGFPAFPVYNAKLKLWRVQVGAFPVKANADSYMKQVKAAGYEAFPVAPDIKGAA
jgi:N-acetylmuramoyl-L-alanine amidase